MIKEHHVTFQQAKHLKELGFPQDYEEIQYYISELEQIVPKLDDECIFALPTLYIAQEWIRVAKRIYIQTSIDFSGKFYCVFYDTVKPYGTIFNDTDMFNSPYEALSNAIDNVIEFLLKTKNK